MKPYFAEYLPVEGEIKEGDKFLTAEGNLYIYGDEKTTGLEFPTVRTIKYSDKKVKLFLCSRDIQVGDRFYSISRNIYDIVSNEHHIKLLEIQSGGWVKPIGEISPEATWVTEGMEFDEDDLRWIHTGSIYNPHPGMFIKFDPNPSFQLPQYYRVAIKGPCGHFH